MATRDLVVLGYGGLGREIADTVTSSLQDTFRLVGYLDDDTSKSDSIPYLGPIDSSNVPEGAMAILGVGDPQVRYRIARDTAGLTFASVTHPTASVSAQADVAAGTYIAQFCFVGTDAVVGPHTVLNIYSSVGHDAATGSSCVISPYATMNGHAVLGDGVLLGTSAVVGISVEVGSWSRVSAGAIQSKSCEEGSLVAGNPAKSRVMFRGPASSSPW